MQLLKYKYKLNPNKNQVFRLNEICGAQRYIWNYYLDLNIMTYQSHKKFVWHYDMNKDLTMLKRSTAWMKDIPSTSFQQTLGYLDKSLKASSKKRKSDRAGFPRFKSRKSNKSFTLTMVNTKRNINGNKFHIPKVGWVRWKMHCDLPNDFRSCTIKEEADGWYVVITTKKKTTKKKD